MGGGRFALRCAAYSKELGSRNPILPSGLARECTVGVAGALCGLGVAQSTSLNGDVVALELRHVLKFFQFCLKL